MIRTSPIRLWAALLLAAPLVAQAQTGGVGIGTTTPAASAALEVSSTSKGFLPPRLTTAQRDAIASPAAGLTIFNTSTGVLNTWDGVRWTEAVTSSPTVTFGYTGGPQTFTVPAGVTALTVDMAGGAGSRTGLGTRGAGLGGRVQATLAVTAGQVLTLQVGGAGGVGAAGYNGGGAGGNSGSPLGGGGGGFRFFSVPGTAAPTASNQVAQISNAGMYFALSDRRVKTNIAPLNQGLRTVLALRPVSYDFHTSRRLENGRVTFLPDDKPVRTLGFVAQDLYQVVPEAVEKPADERQAFYTVSYTTLVPVLTQAIQEQQAQIEALKKQNAALQADAGAAATQAAADHASLLTLQAQMARLLGQGTQASAAPRN